MWHDDNASVSYLQQRLGKAPEAQQGRGTRQQRHKAEKRRAEHRATESKNGKSVMACRYDL
jgi:hypothetical protein